MNDKAFSEIIIDLADAQLIALHRLLSDEQMHVLADIVKREIDYREGSRA